MNEILFVVDEADDGSFRASAVLVKGIRKANDTISVTGASTERDALTKARLGQGLFRHRVAEREPACRVTGLKRQEFLVASHIKPWRDCDNSERLDGANGLLLSPHVDKLFDRCPASSPLADWRQSSWPVRGTDRPWLSPATTRGDDAGGDTKTEPPISPSHCQH